MGGIFQLQQPTPGRSFHQLYEELLWRLLKHGHEEVNERTGKKVKAYPYGGTSFTLDLSWHELPTVGRRKLFPATAAAETAWYIMGTRDPEFMLKHARVVWEKFVEPISDVSMPGVVPFDGVAAAYGYRWRRHFGRDQLLLAVEALRANPSDRRVYVSAWDPSTDGLGAKGQLNVPCPVGFSLSIVDGHLNSTYTLRSSDVFVGLPYDVMGHALLMAATAETLNVRVGHATFALAHPHLYDVHYQMAMDFLMQEPVPNRILLPRWTLEQVEQAPDNYVQRVKTAAEQAAWPAFCPRPEVVA